ncbi:MAG: AAA family ATPase [Candidatus Aegiribacteria sp.]
MVGREPELARALRFASELDKGPSGGILHIWAPPGVGKTRLVQEMERSLPDWSFVFIYGEPSPGSSPFSDFLQRWFGVDPSLDRKTNLRAFGEVWEGLLLNSKAGTNGSAMAGPDELDRSRLWLERLAGLSGSDPSPLRGCEPRQARERTTRALVHFFDLLACQGPLAVVLENTQWFSDRELDSAAGIIRDGTAPSRMFVVTGRQDPGGDTPVLPGTPPLMSSMHMELKGLPRNQIPEIVCGPGGPAPDEALLDYLWTVAGGVPLFIHQTVDFLKLNGSLDQTDGKLILSIPPEDLPSSIRSVFGYRMAMLPRQAGRAVLAASVLGSVFRTGVLRSMLTRQEFSAAAEGGSLAGILLLEGDTGRFEHALLREWTAELAGEEDMEELHLLAAGAMEKEYGAPATPDVLERVATHYMLGGRKKQAAPHFRRAAAGYAENYENEGAARLYRKLIDLLDDPGRAEAELDLYEVYKNGGLLKEGMELLSGTLDRIAAGGADPELEARIRLKLGSCLGSAGELGRAEELVGQALRVFISCSDLENRTVAERQLGMILMSSGRMEEALEYIDGSVEMARRTGNPGLLCASLYWAAIACRETGDHKRMEALTREQVELAERSGLTRSIIAGYDNLMRIHIYRREYTAAKRVHRKLRKAAEDTANWAALNTATSKMGIIHLRTGETEKASDCFRRCVFLSRRTGNLRALCAALGNLAHCFIEMKDTASAIRYSTELIDRSGEIGFRSGLMSGYARMGYILLMMGDRHSALECFETQIEHAEALKDTRNISDGWAKIADIQFSMGDMEGALLSIDRALEHSGRAGDMLLRGSQLAQRGKYLFVRGSYEQARAPFLEALEQNAGRKGREEVVRRCRLFLAALDGTEVLDMLGEAKTPEEEADCCFCQWIVSGMMEFAERARSVLESSGQPGSHSMLQALPEAGSL